MVNPENMDKEAIDSRHYVLRSPKHERRWVAFSQKKIRKYRERWGDDFCLVILGDTDIQDDFYAIPWSHVSDLFVDANVYPARAKDGRVTNRWQIHLEGPPHFFQLMFAKDDPRPRPRFDATPWYGNRTVLLGDSPLNVLKRAFLRAETSHDFDARNLADARERAFAAIVRRQGQPAFRRRLLEIYGGACAFSGCTLALVLDAAHIVPYRGPATNTPQNGLLLRTDIHTLFDLGLLTIDTESMTVIAAESLAGTEYAKLAGRKVHVPSEPSLAPSLAALNEQ